MTPRLRLLAAAVAVGVAAAGAAHAQKLGGVLQMSHFDSPASMSLHEEATAAVNRPMMGVFNNLVLYKQDVAQNSQQSIVPDLATGWSWSEDGTELTFPLRQGVKWHDGKPFTAKDVQCTWDLLTGKASDKLRLNPRKSWYQNLEKVTVNGDYEVTFRLKRPQPSFLAMLASGWSAVYPCHVSPREMRTHPIGTGPFKFIEFKPNELIRVAKNPDYWKPDADPRVHCRQVRHGHRRHRPPVERRQGAGSPGGLPGDTNQRAAHAAGQPRRTAFRQRRVAPGDGTEPRPQGLYRHSHLGTG